MIYLHLVDKKSRTRLSTFVREKCEGYSGAES